MNPVIPLRVLKTTIATIAVLNIHWAHSQSWQTVLDYQGDGHSGVGQGLAADALENIFASGTILDATSTQHGVVLKTDATTLNWSLIDDSNPSPDQYSSRAHKGLGFDSSG